MTNKNPTEKAGKCFERSSRFMLELPQGREQRRYRLCHGILTHPDTGVRFGHGWIEDIATAEVLNFKRSGRKPVRESKYRFVARFKVEELARYTALATARHGLKTGHHGPWLKSMFAPDVQYAA